MEDVEEKAKKFSEMIDNLAEIGAKTFEGYLKENQNASVEEKHNALVKDFHTSIMMALMTIPMVI